MNSIFVLTLNDIVGLFFVALILIVYSFSYIKIAIKQARCKHTSVWENSRCDAICRDCSKNLGFIAAWRDKQP